MHKLFYEQFILLHSFNCIALTIENFSHLTLQISFSEYGQYPIHARIKDWQCTAIAMGLGCVFGLNRKEEMKPVYIRQTSMLKFQDRLTAEVRR